MTCCHFKSCIQAGKLQLCTDFTQAKAPVQDMSGHATAHHLWLEVQELTCCLLVLQTTFKGLGHSRTELLAQVLAAQEKALVAVLTACKQSFKSSSSCAPALQATR